MLARDRHWPRTGAVRKQALAGSRRWPEAGAVRKLGAPPEPCAGPQPGAALEPAPRPTLFWRGVAVQGYVSMKAVLSLLGIVFVIAWLVLWLAVKVTFGAIHLLVVIGVILIIFALVKVI